MNDLIVRNLEEAKTLIYGEEENFIARSNKNDDVNFNREAGYALQAIQKNSFLLSTAQNNPQTLKDSITNIAAIGLTLNPALSLAYLVPMDNSVNLFVSWKGYIALATRSGAIEYAHVELVYKNDTFNMRGMSEQPEHERNPFSIDRGEIVGAYCSVRLPCGDYMTTTMPVEELNKIRNLSKAKNGPWKNWPTEMMKKTVIKRASKMWPESKDIRLAEAIKLSNDSEGIDFEETEKESEEYLEERRNIIKMEMEKKKLLLSEIMEKSAELTEGLDLNGKGLFMIDKLKVKSFGDLKRKPIDDLEEILKGLGNEEV